MDLDSSTQFIVEILQPSQIFTVFLHIHFFSDKISDIADWRRSVDFRLYEHLSGVVFRTTGEHVFFVVFGDRHFIGDEIYFARIEHGYGRRQIFGYFQIEHHAFLLCETVDESVVVAHRFVAVKEVRCRTIESHYFKSVGESADTLSGRF